MRLSTKDHDRDSAGLLYVYPVVSRRAGGVSVGINLNPNNACNWRCIYCQVPDLVSGMAPPIDVARVESELDGFLDALLHRGWMEEHVPQGARTLKDIAFSGNGEPTSSRQLPEVVAAVGRVLAKHALVGSVPVVLITNGSLVQKPHVQTALAALRELGGVVWFKLDSATDAGMRRLNDAKTGAERAHRDLETCARICPTWIQTLALALDGEPPSEEEIEAYLALVRSLVRDGVPVRGVLLYGLARPSHQPEAPRLSALPLPWLEAFAERIRAAGLEVRVSA
ncbi:MAG TPA: radical SAM protein [Planctomycetota bacterium]|jgi:wyosine [tRNA(Phe)-imidazoG37] synthetase (radical SAM superfamily)|nr:radical SAM protein [Planctomycetota bacterium]